jgi:hypothetical protein
MSATNRWGAKFKKGDKVYRRSSRTGKVGGPAYRYIGLEPANAYSRAYGRQAILMSERTWKSRSSWTVAAAIASDTVSAVGLNDLSKSKPK